MRAVTLEDLNTKIHSVCDVKAIIRRYGDIGGVIELTIL
jgi:hypothetical protein